MLDSATYRSTTNLILLVCSVIPLYVHAEVCGVVSRLCGVYVLAWRQQQIELHARAHRVLPVKAASDSSPTCGAQEVLQMQACTVHAALLSAVVMMNMFLARRHIVREWCGSTSHEGHGTHMSFASSGHYPQDDIKLDYEASLLARIGSKLGTG